MNVFTKVSENTFINCEFSKKNHNCHPHVTLEVKSGDLRTAVEVVYTKFHDTPSSQWTDRQTAWEILLYDRVPAQPAYQHADVSI